MKAKKHNNYRRSVESQLSVKFAAISQVSNFSSLLGQQTVSKRVTSQLTTKMLTNSQLSVKPHRFPSAMARRCIGMHLTKILAKFAPNNSFSSAL